MIADLTRDAVAPTVETPSTSQINLALLAPYNESVQVLGTFTNWEPRDLQRSENGWWRSEFELPDGEYEYRFRVKSKSWFALDQWVEIGDPFATRVNPLNGEASVLTVRNGQRVVDEYVWQHDDKPLPADSEIILYEMHVGGFGWNPQEPDKFGTFDAVRAKLDYLVDLGVNAIELMPLHEFPMDYSWGYNPRFHFAVESAYGTSADFKRLVDECHARGIRVLLDVVFNHGENEHPLTKIDYDYWFYHDNPDPEGLRFGPKFDYVHFDEHRNAFPARDYVRACALFWLYEYHLDGFRFDATALINNFDFLRDLREVLKANSGGKPLLTIAEHLPSDPAVAGPNGPLDAAWNFCFHDQIKANILGKEYKGRKPYDIETTLAALDARREGYSSTNHVVNFTTSHDESYALGELGAAGVFDQAAFRRAKNAATLLLTAPGIPMLEMGEEFGEYSPTSIEDVRIHWELLGTPLAQDLHTYYKSLLVLRKTNRALQLHDNIEFLYTDPKQNVLAFKRWQEQGNVVIVVVNLNDTVAGQVEIPNIPADGTWHEWIRNYDVTVEGGILRDQLAESEIKIYLKS
jgi:1,4-alpha-glucan branching enzyme